MLRRRTIFILLVLTFAVCTAVRAEEELDLKMFEPGPAGSSDPATMRKALDEVLHVGDLADVEKLVFEGVTLFPERELRNALAIDLKYQAAARPSNDTSNYLDTLEQRLLEGYLHSGCPDARVRTWRDSNRPSVVVHVDEGPRFVQGEIRVSGPVKFDKAALVKWLTTRQGNRRWKYEYGGEAVDDLPEDPVAAWTPGKVARFDTFAKGKLDVAIRTALIEMGYPYARPTYGMMRNEKTGTADLQIEIRDDELPAELGMIQVTGLERDSKAPLLKLLDVKPGERFNVSLLEKIDHRLADSCRYWNYKVTARFAQNGERYDSLPEPVTIHLDLEEYELAPPLGQPLAEEDEIMRKAAAWIAQTKSAKLETDLVVQGTLYVDDESGNDLSLKIVVGAKGGVAIDVADSNTSKWNLDHGVVISPGEFAIIDWRWREKFTAHCEMTPQIKLEVNCPPKEDNEYKASIFLGLMLKSPDDSGEAPNGVIAISAVPVAMVNFIHRPDTRFTISDGKMVVACDNVKLTLDATTGQFLAYEGVSGGKETESTFSIRSQPGAFQQIAAEMRERGDGFADCYDSTRPWLSTVVFAVGQIVKQPCVVVRPDIVRLCHAVDALAKNPLIGRLCERVEQSIVDVRANRDKESRFSIPELELHRSNGFDAAYESCLAAASPFADEMFAYGSWPWALARETSFAYFSEQLDGSADRWFDMAQREFVRLQNSGEIGPAGAMLVAKVFQTAPMFANMGSEMRELGLQDLSDVAFRKDLNLLVRGDHGLAMLCRAVAEEFGKLAEVDQKQLLELFPEAYRGPLEQLAVRRRTMPDEPVEEAIEEVLRQCWHNGLRETVASELRRMSTAVAEAPESEDTTTK